MIQAQLHMSFSAYSFSQALRCFQRLMQHVRGNFLLGLVRVKEDICSVGLLVLRHDRKLHR